MNIKLLLSIVIIPLKIPRFKGDEAIFQIVLVTEEEAMQEAWEMCWRLEGYVNIC